MARKRASNSGSVKPAFGRRVVGDDDVEAPARQSRPEQADPQAQAAALRFGDQGEPASGCDFCSGTWTTGGAFVHGRACIGGRAVTARQAERRRNGLG